MSSLMKLSIRMSRTSMSGKVKMHCIGLGESYKIPCILTFSVKGFFLVFIDKRLRSRSF